MNDLKTPKTLKEDIVSELVEEEKSISGLQKSLETRGINTHRLVLTGYLRAMVDVGILREKEIKPSRIYSIQSIPGKDIYELVGLAARKMTDESTGDYALELLHYIFNRPIFVREIERCNVDLPRQYKSVVPQRRLEYIAKLNEQGIKIPQNNIMMEPQSRDAQKLLMMLKDLVSIILDVKRYIMPDQEGTQTTLD
ncbi:MAG: hypothetical protein M1129_00380 [Candidatus Thermoplasmatota archaeon]|nr:hypothetical protein [Candidatus Thermoplasmatota archaeon]MCL5954504.1 hypothetical protein [Candidatus Thermoplasmatota archaeon]